MEAEIIAETVPETVTERKTVWESKIVPEI
jgi:hypothetical protein